MKKIYTLILLISPLFASSQDKRGSAYVSFILHDMKKPGISLVNSFSIGNFLGLGAGVDVTSRNKAVLVPFYLDVRGKYAIGQWQPYICGQGGYALHNSNHSDVRYTDIGGNPVEAPHTRGDLFYGGGVGVQYLLGRIGLFASFIYRQYRYRYSDKDGNDYLVFGKRLEPFNEGTPMISAGIVF